MADNSSAIQKTSRIDYIDLAKGFCIALVVFFHAKGVLDSHYMLDPFFASFRLPLYFFLSGLFFKSYDGFRVFFIKKVNRLLVPFVFFYFCFSVLVPNLLYKFSSIHFDTVVGWSSLWAFIWPGQYPNIPIWFLWCLFLMNLFFYSFYYIARRLSERRFIILLIILCIISGVVGDYYLRIYPTDIGNFFKAIQCMPFFCFGFLFKYYDGLYRLAISSTFYNVIFILLFLAITFFFSVFFPLFFIPGITGTMLILFIARLIKSMPLFSYIGRYSIILLLTHGLLIRMLTPLCCYFSSMVGSNISIFLLTLTILLSYYLLIPLMCYLLPWVTAQKPLIKE